MTYCEAVIFVGVAIRTKTLKYLAKEFGTVTDAENFYNIDYFSSKSILIHEDNVQSPLTGCTTQGVNEETVSAPASSSLNQSWLDQSSQLLKSQDDIVKELISSFKYKLTPRMQEQLINHLLQIYILQQYGMDLFQYISKRFLPFGC